MSVRDIIQAAAGVDVEPPPPPPPATPWDIAELTYGGSPVNFNFPGGVQGQRSGVFITSDGSKMYMATSGFSSASNLVEFSLSTPYNGTTSSLVLSTSINAVTTTAYSCSVNNDGTKIIVLNTGGTLYSFNLSTPYSLSTLSYSGTSFSTAAQTTSTSSIYFKPDGTVIYVVGSGSVFQYNLSTAFDISTMSYTGLSFALNAITTPLQAQFKPDGTKFFMSGTNGIYYEYAVGTAWNVSTLSYTSTSYQYFPSGVSLNVSTSSPFISNDGLNTFFIDRTRGGGYRSQMTVAWSAATGTFILPTTNYFNIAAQVSNQPACMFFKPDGTKVYLGGVSGIGIFEYTLSTAWEVHTCSFVQESPALASSQRRGLSFKTDGTKMYFVSSVGDSIYEYNLSTAWNVSTISLVTSFSLVSQDTNPYGLYFKPDGTSFYVPGQQNDRVYQYNCSTPWSIATASFYGFVSIVSQTGTPYNCFFKPDGTKMYLNGNGSFFQYALGTAWDVTTASYEKVGSSLPAESIPYGIYIKDDGLRLWAVGLVRQSFLGYNFTT